MNALAWSSKNRGISPTLVVTMGRPDDAEPFLRDALTAYPAAARARITYARLLERRGDRAGAGREVVEARKTRGSQGRAAPNGRSRNEEK